MYEDAISVSREGNVQHVQFRAKDVERLIAYGAAHLLGFTSNDGLRCRVEFKIEGASGAVLGATVSVEDNP